jgi:transcriptional regulator with XRE-family HTH domain
MPDSLGMNLSEKEFEKLSFRERCSLHIQVRRKRKGFTQEKLSEFAGFHRTYVSNFERGVQNMSLDAVESLRTALGIELVSTEGLSLRQTFAKNLRDVRVKRDVSQEDLGFTAGLHRTYVSQAERCVTNISLDNVERLATALGVTAESLVGFDTRPDVKAARAMVEKMQSPDR